MMGFQTRGFAGALTTVFAMTACTTPSETVEIRRPSNTKLVLETYAELKAASEALPQNFSLSAASNVPQFCQVNGYRDSDPENFQKLRHGDAWYDGFFAVRDARESSFLYYFDPAGGGAIRTLDEKARAKSYGLVQQRLNSLPLKISTSLKTRLLNGTKRLMKTTADQSNALEVGLLQAAYLCKDLDLQSTLKCANKVQVAVKIAKPAAAVTVIPLWNELSRDPNYYSVFRKVAFKITERLKTGDAADSRLDEDVLAEFKNLVHDANKASEYTWKTMALLASGGGATARRVSVISMEPESNELADVLWVLTAGSMALDRISANKGYLYTYPRAIENLCDYGKNYHFWMAAYLARETMKNDGDAVSSAAAAYTVEKGYQFAKTGAGRAPERPYADPLFSNYNNNIRLDLSLASIGVWYGTAEAKLKLTRKQVDSILISNFQHSAALEKPEKVAINFDNPNPTEIIPLYDKWKKIINPDEGFLTLKKQLGH
jgi:hypothetical protein